MLRLNFYWCTYYYDNIIIKCVFERVNCVVGIRLTGRRDSQTTPRRKPHNNHEILFNNSRHLQIIPGLCAP